MLSVHLATRSIKRTKGEMPKEIHASFWSNSNVLRNRAQLGSWLFWLCSLYIHSHVQRKRKCSWEPSVSCPVLLHLIHMDIYLSTTVIHIQSYLTALLFCPSMVVPSIVDCAEVHRAVGPDPGWTPRLCEGPGKVQEEVLWAGADGPGRPGKSRHRSQVGTLRTVGSEP